jgi:hypothetical protein
MWERPIKLGDFLELGEVKGHQTCGGLLQPKADMCEDVKSSLSYFVPFDLSLLEV